MARDVEASRKVHIVPSRLLDGYRLAVRLLQQSSVDAQPRFRLIDRHPVSHATTLPTPVKLNHLISPEIGIRRVRLGHDLDLFDLVVRPLRGVSTADGTVAFVEALWLMVEMDGDGFAVASQRHLFGRHDGR